MAKDTESSIVVKKSSPYRDGSKIWSNRYHFTNGAPSDPGKWEAFADAIVAAEKGIYNAETTIIQVVGYDASTATDSNPHGNAVFTKDYTTVGTFVPGVGDVGCPGDCAALLRYSTPERSKKNHPIYLMSYFHNAYNTAADGDALAGDMVTAVNGYGTAWIAGFSDGSEGHARCGPTGALAISRRVDPQIRHRDFPS